MIFPESKSPSVDLLCTPASWAANLSSSSSSPRFFHRAIAPGLQVADAHGLALQCGATQRSTLPLLGTGAMLTLDGSWIHPLIHGVFQVFLPLGDGKQSGFRWICPHPRPARSVRVRVRPEEVSFFRRSGWIPRNLETTSYSKSPLSGCVWNPIPSPPNNLHEARQSWRSGGLNPVFNPTNLQRLKVQRGDVCPFCHLYIGHVLTPASGLSTATCAS